MATKKLLLVDDNEDLIYECSTRTKQTGCCRTARDCSEINKYRTLLRQCFLEHAG